MVEQYPANERSSLLADVAEMYYLEEKGQAEIARAVGVTRSMVSRMLKEAREKGIVEVRVHRPLNSEYDLELALAEHFPLLGTYIVSSQRTAPENNLTYLGSAGALVLKRQLKAGAILGISWGTSVSAAVDALHVEKPIPVKIVQLVGALGARNAEYDGHALVTRLAEKLGGDGYHLNAPFLCPNPETAAALLETQGIRELVDLGRMAEVALLGIGSTAPLYSSAYLAGYLPFDDLEQLIQAGAVGDVCGVNYDIHGENICADFCKRLVTISKDDLLSIPVRIGIAGGQGKVIPILGALRGGYINFLVTDGDTARQVLELAAKI